MSICLTFIVITAIVLVIASGIICIIQNCFGKNNKKDDAQNIFQSQSDIVETISIDQDN